MCCSPARRLGWVFRKAHSCPWETASMQRSKESDNCQCAFSRNAEQSQSQWRATMLNKRSLMILTAAASLCVALNGPALAQAQFRISTAAAEGDWLNKALQKFKEGIE